MLKTTALILIIVLIILTALIPQITHTATHAQPPIQRLWESPDLGGAVEGIVFSPDGTRLAVRVSSKVFVFSSSGKLLWERDLGGAVKSITFSPDGTKLAAGVGGRVTVFSSSGKLLWERDLGGAVGGVAWSPDSTKLVAGTWSKVIVFSSSGSKLWESPDLGDYVWSVAWSPDGTKIAAGTGKSHRVIVFSSSGSKLWESEDLGDWVRSIVFSPDGTRLAVRVSSKVFVFSSSGKLLWERDLGGAVGGVAWSPDGTKLAVRVSSKVFVFSSSGKLLWEKYLGDYVWSVAWSPDGTKIAVGTAWKSHRVVVFSSSGSKLWESPDLGGAVRSVAFSLKGGKIVAGVGWEDSNGDHGRVVVFSWVDFGVVRVSGVSFGCRVCFFGGSVTNCYALNSSGLVVYADPGSYEVRYYLTNLPQDHTFIGDVTDYFKDKPIVKTLSVKAGETYSVNPPTLSDFLFKLGKVVIKGLSSVDLRVRVSWGSGSKVLNVSAGGSVEAYATPGNYEVRYYLAGLPPGYEFVGDLKYFDSHPIIKQIHVSAGGSYLLGSPSIDEFFGKLSIHAPKGLGLVVNISWGSGSRILEIPPGSEVSVPAIPGNYVIKLRVSRALPNLLSLIGPSSRLKESLISKRVSVLSAGDHVSVSPSVNDFLGSVEVVNSLPFPVVMNISWYSGSHQVYLNAGDKRVLLMVPGKYSVNVKASGSAPSDIVGDLSSLKVEIPLMVESSTKRLLNVNSSIFGSFAYLRVVGPAGASVKVSWPGGSRSFTIPASGKLELRAVPNTNYSVEVPAPDPFHSGFSSVISVSSAGSVSSVYVSFQFSSLFYGIMFGIIGALGASFYVFTVRPRISVRVLTKEVVEGVTEFIVIEFRNSGLIGTSFKASVEVEGLETFSEVIRLPGRSRKEIKVPIRPNLSGGEGNA